MRISDWSSDVCSSDLIYASHIIERNNPNQPYSNANALVNTNKQKFFRKLKQRVSLFARDTVEAFRDSVILDPPQDEIRTIINPHYDSDDPASGPYEIQETLRAGEMGLDTIGRANVCTPVTNEHPVCRLLLDKHRTSSPT